MNSPSSIVCPACGLSYGAKAAQGQCPRCALAGALSAADAPLPSVEPEKGRIAHFELIDELGRGAMGRVWLARDTQLDRLIALKTLPTSPDPTLRNRLEREARIAAALHHPNIISVHSLGHAGDTIWLAMEFAEGGDLRARLRDRPLPVREAAAYAEKLARALASAHAAGVLHRDIKPSNILLDAAGEPKLADFGLAAPQQGGDLTLTGQILGTASYLAPECLKPAGERSPAQAHLADVYSLGALLYEMLAGRPPFVGDTTAVILLAVSTQEPVAISRLRAKVPRDLETIALKCLEKDPSRRYASAADLAADLAAFREGRPITGRPVSATGRLWRWGRREPKLALAAAVVALLLLAVAIISTSAAVHIAHAESRADAQATRATRAEAATREQLRAALLAQAHANRLSGSKGQRFATLETLRQAAAIRPGADLRDEAILALTLPDLQQTQSLVARTDVQQHAVFDEHHPRFAIETQPGTWEIHSWAGGRILSRLTSTAGTSLSRSQFSPDGHYFVTRTNAGHVVVWDLEKSGAPLLDIAGRRYVLAKSGLRDFGAPDAISPDGHVLASADDETGFTLIELPSGKELARIPTQARVTNLVFSPDGQKLAVARGLRGQRDSERMFFSIARMAHPAELHEIPGKAIQSLDWSGDSTHLFGGSAAWDLLDADTGQSLITVRDEASYGFLTPDGGRAFTIRKSGLFKLWDLRTGEVLLRGGLEGGVELGMSADRQKIFCESGVGNMIAFDLVQPGVEKTIPVPGPSSWDNAARVGSNLTFSPDGRLLVVCAWGRIYLRDGVTGQLLDSVILESENDMTSAVFSPEGNAVFVGTEGSPLQRIPIIPAASGAAKFGAAETIDPEKGYLVTDLSPDGKQLLLLKFRGGMAKIVTVDHSRPPVAWPFPQPSRGMFCDGGKTALINGYSKLGKLPIQLFDVTTGQPVRAIGLTQGYELSWSRDRRWAVLGTDLKASGVWRTDSWKPGAPLPVDDQGAGKATAFSPDGSMLAINWGNEITLVRFSDGRVLARLEMDRSDNFAPGLEFSPDGQRLAVLWHLGQLTLWNLPVLHSELAKVGLDW